MSKNILLSVIGLSPQVLTEALYALWTQGKRVDEIHVITTKGGRDLIHSALLASGDGKFFEFLEEYEIPAESIDFSPGNIHVLTATDGYPLEDISGLEENEALMQKCMEMAWKFTSDPATTVFFLIAGGRKTMSACLALAAQFYGRPQDRIYHVLVSPPFESCGDFFYPPRKPRLVRVKTEHGQVFIKSDDAKVALISMPFVSIRKFLDPEALRTPCTPDELRMAMVRDEPARLMVDMVEGRVAFKGFEVDLSPAMMALYGFFALQRRSCGCGGQGASDWCNRCFLDIDTLDERKDEVWKLYKAITSVKRHQYLPDKPSVGWFLDSKENFNSMRSRTNGRLRPFMGDPKGHLIEIGTRGNRPYTRYGIAFPASNIEIRLP